MRWLFAALAVLICGVLVYLQGSASLALDRERRYTIAASELGLFDGRDGIARVTVDTLEFRVRFAGFAQNPSGPVILLLHGFPTTSAMWLPLFEPLIAQGFRVVAPDQRGYSPGARPTAVQEYRTELLAGDVVALADALGVERFHLVGHDWGAVVGWHVTAAVPARIQTWTAMSIPHPRAFQHAVASDPEQARRSRYMRWLQLPWLPEVLMARDAFAALRKFTDTLPAATASEYLAMYAEPGAATATINWYRAMGIGELPGQISVPTLFLWGVDDPVVTRASVAAQSSLVAQYREVALSAGHRPLVDAPDAVSTALLEHLHSVR